MSQTRERPRTKSLPGKHDVLLKPISRVSDGGHVDWGFREAGARFGPCGRWSHLAEGYRRAGDAVVGAALGEGGADVLVFPAVFLYRHYIELQLKSHVEQLHEMGFTGERRTVDHNLCGLWRRLREALGDFGSNLPSDAISSTERLIGEIGGLDRGSYSFRYGEDKSGNDLLKGTHSVDMRNLRDVMEKLDNFFTALDQEINDEQEVQQDLNDYLDPSE